MIKLIEKTINEKLNIFTKEDLPLKFLKFSTPSSGATLYDKVNFFVFGAHDKNPRLCIKTVRYYKAREVIVRNFKNLQKLNKLVKDSSCNNTFANALYLYDDGDNIFSIETACIGKKLSPISKNLKILTKNYFAFQKCCFEKEKDFIQNIRIFGIDLIKQGGFKEDDEIKLIDYFKNSSFGKSLIIPKIIQHGDLTLDNVLFAQNKIHIVDYDYVGISYLPGFDLFNLFVRYNRSSLCVNNIYWIEYFKMFGIESSNLKLIFFLCYLSERIFKKKYLLKNKTAVQIIEDFEKILL